MPIYHDIIYNASTGRSSSHSCQQGDSTRVTLVQDAIVKHDGSYVELIEISYAPDAAGSMPTGDFTLDLLDLDHEVLPIEVEDIAGANPFTHSHTTDTGADKHILTFSPPTGTDAVTTVFNLGSDAGPPTKLVIKIKRRPEGYTCPP